MVFFFCGVGVEWRGVRDVGVVVVVLLLIVIK